MPEWLSEDFTLEFFGQEGGPEYWNPIFCLHRAAFSQEMTEGYNRGITAGDDSRRVETDALPVK